jgi:hypothetical protein
MQHADAFASGGFQLTALDALVLPDGLQQFFRRRVGLIAQGVNGAAAFAPDGVKIFSAGIHARCFCSGARTKSSRQIILIVILVLILKFQTASKTMRMRMRRIIFERNQMTFCLFNVKTAEVFVSRRRNFRAKLAKSDYGQLIDD